MGDANITKAGFSQYLAEHKLMGTVCANCGAEFLPPRPMCPECFGGEMHWKEMGSTGKLAAYTVVHIASTMMIEAGYGRNNPHCSGIVTLDNGLSISAQILGVDTAHPETIQIGTPVEVAFVERGEGDQKETYLAFQVVGS